MARRGRSKSRRPKYKARRRSGRIKPTFEPRTPREVYGVARRIMGKMKYNIGKIGRTSNPLVINDLVESNSKALVTLVSLDQAEARNIQYARDDHLEDIKRQLIELGKDASLDEPEMTEPDRRARKRFLLRRYQQISRGETVIANSAGKMWKATMAALAARMKKADEEENESLVQDLLYIYRSFK